jgi:Protein of unknown function (DUF2783)
MPLTFADTEAVYERLAAAIDEAGPEKSDVFLAKLALVLAQHIGQTDVAISAIETCLKDL